MRMLGRHKLAGSQLHSSLLAPRLTAHRLLNRPAGPRLRQLLRPQASLYHLPSDLQSSVQTALGIAWLLAVPFSALPILTGEAKERNEQLYARPNQDQGAENVRWTVMGVLSFLPFLNWLVS